MLVTDPYAQQRVGRSFAGKNLPLYKLVKFAGQAGKLMRLSVMRSWVEERKLRIFDNAVVGIVLATLVISFAAVLFAALAIPGTRVFVSLIFFCVQFRRNARRLNGALR